MFYGIRSSNIAIYRFQFWINSSVRVVYRFGPLILVVEQELLIIYLKWGRIYPQERFETQKEIE